MSADTRADQIKELARTHAEVAIRTLVEVAGNEKAKESARVKAADVLLQRGFGAPERTVQQNVDVTIVDQRQAHFSALQRINERRKLPTPEKKPEIEILDAEWEEVQEKKKG